MKMTDRTNHTGERFAISGAARLILGAVFVLVTAASPWWLTHGVFLSFTQKASMYSARLFSMTPAAAASDSAPVVSETAVTEAAVIQDRPADTASGTDSPAAETAAETTSSSLPSEDESRTDGDEAAGDASPNLRPVRESQIGNSGTAAGGIYVRNGAGYDLDIESALSERADCRILLNAGYQVLIIHTHTTETYARSDSSTYDPEYSPRTTDKSRNMVAVGDVVAAQLEAAGIRTLHVTTIHDYPEYNGSYDRAAETISTYLEKYPSIEMVIDIHRDSITQDDGTKLKPTVTIDGRKAAQIMIITGCDNNGKLYFPNWQMNLRMASQLQRQLTSDWDGLMRPLYFAPFRYNMHLTPNSLLVEFGTDVNTLDEAKYSAEMFGKSLAELLLTYEVRH